MSSRVDAFFSQPHTLTGLVLMLGMIAQLLTTRPPTSTSSSSHSFQDDIRTGIYAASACFLFYCSIMLHDGQVVSRPHPVVWRLVHGMTLLYLVAIVFLLAQSSEANVDNTIKLFEPRAGSAELPRVLDNSIACRLTWENIYPRVDIFFAAHFFGWFVKALILRNWGLMWTCSLLFEVLEVTFQNAIPNFRECWWDRWLFDVFGCNLLGMIVGMKFAEWLGAREFDWSGTATGSRSRIKRVALQFTPPHSADASIGIRLLRGKGLVLRFWSCLASCWESSTAFS